MEKEGYREPLSVFYKICQTNKAISSVQYNPYVFLCDFNAHSAIWWDEHQQSLNARGKILEEFLDIHGLVTLNCNQPTHFNLTHNTKSTTDLSISSSDLAPWFQWTVDSDMHDSDHYPISLRFSFGVSGVSCFFFSLEPGQNGLGQIPDLCEFEPHEPFDNPVDGISYISNTILSAAKQSIPVTKHCKKGTAVSWETPTVQQALAKRKRAFRAYLRLRTDQAIVVRNKERAIAKRVMKNAKRDFWPFSSLHSLRPHPSAKDGMLCVVCQEKGLVPLFPY